jgi:hypothetical protein
MHWSMAKANIDCNLPTCTDADFSGIDVTFVYVQVMQINILNVENFNSLLCSPSTGTGLVFLVYISPFHGMSFHNRDNFCRTTTLWNLAGWLWRHFPCDNKGCKRIL